MNNEVTRDCSCCQQAALPHTNMKKDCLIPFVSEGLSRQPELLLATRHKSGSSSVGECDESCKEHIFVVEEEQNAAGDNLVEYANDNWHNFKMMQGGKKKRIPLFPMTKWFLVGLTSSIWCMTKREGGEHWKKVTIFN